MAERTVRSPLPGTFFRRPSPEAEPFVKEGDAVATGDVIGLVEVMKTYYELKADQDGVADRFLIEDGAPLDAQNLVVVALAHAFATFTIAGRSRRSFSV